MKLLVMIATILVLIGTTSSLSYPIFGTKRYHRGGQRTELTQHTLRQPVYENGYLTNNGYYYYPHHEYHSYGMPTYRGEYKPKAYYYASGPSYNYYNDREPVSNPLDDLHEEILQENEQERQSSDVLGDDDYEEDYYIEPSEKPHDTYTNNFLRNMVDYNRQKDKHQRLQQLYHQQIDQLNEDNIGEEEHPTEDDYFSEIEVNPDDFQFEPKGDDNFDLQKYWDDQMSYLANGATGTAVHDQRDAFNEPIDNDRDIQELKSLTKHDNDDEDYKKRYHVKVKQELAPLNNWVPHQIPELSLPQQKDSEDDYGSLDYDDGSWINWDRKRSSMPEKARIRKRILTAFKNEPDNSLNRPALRFFSKTKKSPENLSNSLGQKEKYPTEGTLEKSRPPSNNINGKYDININEDRKSHYLTERGIYDTIKQMISIEQELKKTGSKKRKRYITDEASLVTQLDSLRIPKN